MTLVNESGQEVFYSISTTSMADCGTIDVDAVVDLPAYDNQTNVAVSFQSTSNDGIFIIDCANSGTGEQVEMALVAE